MGIDGIARLKENARLSFQFRFTVSRGGERCQRVLVRGGCAQNHRTQCSAGALLNDIQRCACGFGFSVWTETSTIEVDGGAADFFDIGLRDAASHALLAPVDDGARKLFAGLVRHGGCGIGEANDAPNIVGALSDANHAAPSIDGHELGHREAVTKRNLGFNEPAEPATDALGNDESLGKRELPHGIGFFRVHAAGDGIDRALTERENGFGGGQCFGIDLCRNGAHVSPGAIG